ncbi:ABC transporter permease [Pediococcus acidilactici]|uniref:ABC transporter permease n=1 Tax=Pediococcus acidilactici TaxID=1254 RepID=UPI001BD537E4|nr:ABC transporter permease [Pediococcus acidilactici]MBS9400072.1 ABC transporter permease [Pediococcus acidilactici]
MKMFKFFKLSIDSILRNKSRNFLTVVGIIIGISSVILIMSIGEGFKQSTLKEFNNNSDTIEVEFQPNDNDEETEQNVFTDADQQLVRQVPGIKDIQLTATDNSIESQIIQGKKKKNIYISLTDTSTKIANTDIKEGDRFTESNVKNGDNVVYISSKVFKFLKRNGNYDGTININNTYFYVVGVLNSDESTFIEDIVMPTKSYENSFGVASNKDTLKFKVKNSWNKKDVQNKVLNELANFGTKKGLGHYKLVNSEKVGKSIGKIIDYITYFIISVAGISLFIAGVGVMNTMYMTVSERSQEIGIRRAFGANKVDIRTQFLMESALLCLLGGLAGVGIGFASDKLCALFLPFKPILSIKFVILALAISTSVGLIFGYIPANKAAKNNLIKIL